MIVMILERANDIISCLLGLANVQTLNSNIYGIYKCFTTKEKLLPLNSAWITLLRIAEKITLYFLELINV